MTDDYRILISGNSGDGFKYEIVTLSRDTYFGKLVYGEVAIAQSSEKNLKALLKAALKAFDRPRVHLVPERLEEVERP